MAEAWVLGLMGFVCRGRRGSWVCGFCSLLYPPPPSLPLTVRLLSLKFSLVLFLLLLLFFFYIYIYIYIYIYGYGVDFWMNADCGGTGSTMGLGLLLNVDGLWWWWLTVASR